MLLLDFLEQAMLFRQGYRACPLLRSLCMCGHPQYKRSCTDKTYLKTRQVQKGARRDKGPPESVQIVSSNSPTSSQNFQMTNLGKQAVSFLKLFCEDVWDKILQPLLSRPLF